MQNQFAEFVEANNPVPWTENRTELERKANLLAGAFDAEVQLVPVSWLKNQAITVGPFILIPETWSSGTVSSVLTHEVSGHVRQYAALGGGFPTLGIPLFLLIYGLLLLPAGLALGRVMFEVLAVRAKWRRWALAFGEDYPDTWDKMTLLEAAKWTDRLWSKMYFWAAPSWVTRPLLMWIRRRLRRNLIEESSNASK